LIFATILLWCASVWGQDQMTLIGGSEKELLTTASKHFALGRYQTTAEELEDINKQLLKKNLPDEKLLGLIYYWKGVTYARMLDYPKACENFKEALKLKFSAQDIHYEYGQALYASEKNMQARHQFKLSLAKNFKPAISLYYVAFLTKELGENDMALALFKKMDKIKSEESKDIRQAVEMQIGDIYLEMAEKHKDTFRAVEKFVIPQYEKAQDFDKDSGLAKQIKERITGLQRKYDLILFNLRNGRPTIIPPYFLRLAEEIGVDTNVTFSPNETTISKSKQSSVYSKTDLVGRYTFYPTNYVSVAPELRFNNTYYFHRVKEIYRNDNQLYAPALRTTYEHSYNSKPASVLFDYDFNEALRDVNAQQKLGFSSRSHTFMLGERFNLFGFGDTTLRVRQRTFNSYLSSQNSQTWSFVAEQIKPVGANTLLFYLSLDRARVADNIYNTNAATFRTDFIMAKIWNFASPSFGFSTTRTDPLNNHRARGIETQINPNARLYKTFGSFRGSLKYDYMRNYSRDATSFAYKKQTYGFELEYLF
jgi:tetratricopeptide (TPR) repeat protein